MGLNIWLKQIGKNEVMDAKNPETGNSLLY